ncbi:hypothetical protein CXB51_021770 [Gossypium anomalum]|uniref:Endonuclease/exonuclease/phosphatase domain-containing protein n=1 Tax=Gossypium anomalum TaxID=47600 RepID=A0A8J5YY60_9ROSI|nr:hypothetical protein CXB51_021770 [Gossypium anomalum]
MKIVSWNVRGLGQPRTVQHVAAVGTGGGLSLGWNEGLSLTLKSFSKSHIDVEVENEDEQGVWRFTGFYGAPIENERKES